MKIVVRTPNWIGDSILATPAIESLHKNFPDAQIWIAAKEWSRELFVYSSHIEGIISLPDTDDLRSLRKSVHKIKKSNFDTGILLTNSFSSALLFYLARIPQRWGYMRDGRSFLLTKGAPLKKKEGRSHQIDYYLELISDLGLKPCSPRISLPITQEEKEKSKEKLLSLNVAPKHPVVILHPGASYGPAKRWPPEKYAELAKLIQKRKDAAILITGSPEEVELAESLASFLTKKPINLAGRTSLRELAGLISQAHLFITNDSGPMHMANALQIPVIAIFGPTDPAQTGPFQEPAVVIKKDVPCWPCSYRECLFDHRCMINIEPEEVFQACERFL